MDPHHRLQGIPLRPGARSLLRLLVAAAAMLMLVTGEASAQLVSGRFVTSMYTWEKFDTVGASQTYLRAFQTAQLTVAQGDLSLHTYLQGAVNAASDFGDLGRVRAYNLFVRWANIGKMVDLSLGRIPVYAGVGNGTIDGAQAKGRFFDRKLTVTGYWGAVVPTSYTQLADSWSKNQMLGGQIVTTALKNTRLGVSYTYRREERPSYVTVRPDSDYIARPYTVTFDGPSLELLGGDAYVTLARRLSLYGRYDYDLLNMRTSRGQLGGRLQIIDRLDVTAEYIHRVPRISFNSLFSAFVNSAVDEVEGGVEYDVLPRVRAFGRLANVIYADDQSLRWTLGVNSGYGSLAYSGSSGYAGELSTFSLYGAYPLMENMLVPSAGVTFTLYRLNPGEDRRDALAFLAGATFRPSPPVAIDLQGQWLANAVYANDLRLQARFTYWFSEHLELL